MTEAISIIKSIRKEYEKKKFGVEAFDIAIESMEKQIPKKPLADSLGERGIGFLIPLCPRCQRSIERTEALDVYCKYCGQAIDWEEGGTSD